ncbi:carbohydrate-binding domain-containing protein [Faecalibacterium sp. I4-3-84]|uniref:carbohydrate-binding domain-containing protein n=1 Tax=Faecalibacterium sp. I4-3-84 TaxID=2929495 RepID=UPI0020150192|nr:carbohydrate-binding domain-containing protein [Faecalibacterium sp. I4-3-84]UQK38322.1 carbohydrate-binding domain-containing protein [Faecalibacterium sp. I4-3-84]
MKQGKLIRRAVSAALAGCMMFTLSAPALAESTDALMQLSTAAKSAVSVLGEKNGTLKIGNNSFDTETNIPEQELGGGTISYDAETHTLTLNGVNIEDSSGDWVIDFNDTDTLLNLVLMGENLLKGKGGIRAHDLKISGTGSLQITATNYEGIAGIGQSGDNLTIGSDVDITAMNGCAIAFNGSVRIENGATVKAKCLYGGIDCYDLTIDSATEVNLESTGEQCNAIYVRGDNDGTVAGTANIKNSKLVLKSDYPAFYAEDGIEISGGSVEAESASDVGIFTRGELSITDADIDASGCYFGIGSNGAMEMTGGKLKAVGQNNGVYIRNSLTLNNVEVDAECENWTAISSMGPMVLNGGKIEAVSKNASDEEAYAIYAGNRYDGDDGDAELLAEGSLTIKGNAKVHVSGYQGIGSDGQTTIGEADIEIDSTDFSIVYPVQIENGNKILSLKGGTNKESATVLNPDDFVWDRPDPNCIGKNAYLHIITGPVADPDETPDPGAGYDASSAAGGAIAAVAVGGAAIWGGYEITTRVILHSLLPEGAAIPANRGQLALLVWNTAGRPEPAGAPAFADVADADMAKAAQWCTEQGIMDAKGDRFEPEGWTPKFKVIEVWNKAFPKQ